jgi:apolipoprotein D and lipocalin family protein
MRPDRRLAAGLAAALALIAAAPAAAAQAPEPRRPLDMQRFIGRWHEILRTPNAAQRDCHAASQVWSAGEEGRYRVLQTCRRGGPDGPARNIDSTVRVLNPGENTRFEASFFGGLIRQRYWVVDRADDYSWMIATTADGRFPAVLARTPDLPPAEVARLRRRVAELGLPADGLTPSRP